MLESNPSGGSPAMRALDGLKESETRPNDRHVINPNPPRPPPERGGQARLRKRWGRCPQTPGVYRIARNEVARTTQRHVNNNSASGLKF